MPPAIITSVLVINFRQPFHRIEISGCHVEHKSSLPTTLRIEGHPTHFLGGQVPLKTSSSFLRRNYYKSLWAQAELFNWNKSSHRSIGRSIVAHSTMVKPWTKVVYGHKHPPTDTNWWFGPRVHMMPTYENTAHARASKTWSVLVVDKSSIYDLLGGY